MAFLKIAPSKLASWADALLRVAPVKSTLLKSPLSISTPAISFSAALLPDILHSRTSKSLSRAALACPMAEDFHRHRFLSLLSIGGYAIRRLSAFLISPISPGSASVACGAEASMPSAVTRPPNVEVSSCRRLAASDDALDDGGAWTKLSDLMLAAAAAKARRPRHVLDRLHADGLGAGLDAPGAISYED
eukprot:CAMPEP_0115067508 /NCGR_PEP_ID=MMETSP0227-20121206/11435_1 /TAXON_ID=89957 /ORGANISM="Polarella glacialis, Strain CCMP 1383" /LENGTH=189 /DNA_ID=CAMNT_0002453595 /DNA_START=367 /DNA_END=936 /DNA_ORIENTATION=-